jgi:hypothetical protein
MSAGLVMYMILYARHTNKTDHSNRDRLYNIIEILHCR